MWIRSQDKIKLINTDRLEIVRDGISASVRCFFKNSIIYLGEYSTEEKAMKVLGLISDCIKDMYSPSMYEPAYEFYERGIFQMPLDEEV